MADTYGRPWIQAPADAIADLAAAVADGDDRVARAAQLRTDPDDAAGLSDPFCTRPATCYEMCLTTANGQPSTVAPWMVRQVSNGNRVHRA
ncbi:hypothetical protein [Mycobacterium sp.]|uniref:hypothetical protein n=1 Tax=Mycobacterium sp. TaxID=1785 RepID=UPI003F94B121